MSDGGLLLFPSGVSPELVGAVEALLFASGEPATIAAIATALQVEPGDVRLAIEVLRTQLSRPGRGLTLDEVGPGWQLRTSPRHAEAILRFTGARPARLSRAALEVLALVAYRQPITRGEVDAMRGVDSGAVLRSLLDRGLLRTAGRRDEPGRPLEYRTAPAFLELFSLTDLAELPTLRERG
ncbi:MAG: SMC-Scp complex subunit ScpB [Deltaproteobacteria bacterium]|nr:SMC-Scp complex subunit ScpB [Deltaproteobacteria bacterium]